MNTLARLLVLIATLSNQELVAAAPVSGRGTWESTLSARDLDGNISTIEGYYDSTLQITWLANANYSGEAMTWVTASMWLGSLNIGGHTGWRLPQVLDTNSPGCNSSYGTTDCGYNVQTIQGSTTYSEAATLFYRTLGNVAWYDINGVGPQPGSGLVNTANFFNIQDDASVYYWIFGGGAEPRLDRSDHEWVFEFAGGTQGLADESAARFVWAVHDGDIGTAVIPVPGTLWLLGLGVVIAGLRRRVVSIQRSFFRLVVCCLSNRGTVGAIT